MKILHTESSLGWGGQEIRVLSEARGVARLGHEVLLAAPAEARITAEAARFGVPVLCLPIGRKSPRGVVALRRLIASSAFDVVNTHSSTDSWLAALACATLGKAPALVRTRHISSPIPRDPATRWLYARAARRIVTTGERLREEVIARTGAAPSRVVSIPTGIDLARFSPGDRSQARRLCGLVPDGLVIGIVATLRSWKGHLYLIDAFARLSADARLVIVGDGPMRAALEARIAERALVPRVTLAGNRDEVAPWMQSFDIFCLPSYANEGVPQALMQALACGLPVVTTNVGSIGEIVEDGRTAIVVPPRDVGALHAALETLAGDPAARARMGQAASAGRARFGEDLMSRRMAELFGQACG